MPTKSPNGKSKKAAPKESAPKKTAKRPEDGKPEEVKAKPAAKGKAGAVEEAQTIAQVPARRLTPEAKARVNEMVAKGVPLGEALKRAAAWETFVAPVKEEVKPGPSPFGGGGGRPRTRRDAADEDEEETETTASADAEED